MRMGRAAATAAVLCGAMLATGCHSKQQEKKDKPENLAAAINNYYSGHPECLFAQEKKLPAQADSKNSSETAPWDALYDQGLLTRTTGEKSKLIVMTKTVNNYDLTDKGRSAWTADPNQPGYGNFCYGNRKVVNITAHTPVASDEPGVATQVDYTYTIDHVADWARAAEVQNAYPNLKAKLAGASSGQAQLVMTTNGWQVQKTGNGIVPPSNADGSIVQ